jgi:hypothetical protein
MHSSWCCRPGLPVIGDIEAPGFLEGGDFFPAGRRALASGLQCPPLAMQADPLLS